MPINPGPTDLERLSTEDPGGPVVMLNLLRFVAGGRAEYVQFTKTLSMKLLQRYGAEVLYAGAGSTPLVAEPDQAWDAVLLVRYPSRGAFRQMLDDPDFEAMADLRQRTLSHAVLQATTPWG
jgi:uncharacterized protein (DUF1330 family)